MMKIEGNHANSYDYANARLKMLFSYFDIFSLSARFLMEPQIILLW